MISAATSTTVRVVAASSASNNNKVRVLDCIQSRENRIFFLFFLFWINFQSQARSLFFLFWFVLGISFLSLSSLSLLVKKEGGRALSSRRSLESKTPSLLSLCCSLGSKSLTERERTSM